MGEWSELGNAEWLKGLEIGAFFAIFELDGKAETASWMGLEKGLILVTGLVETVETVETVG